MEPWIRFERNQISLGEIQSRLSYHELTDTEKQSLKFCKAWLDGLALFTLHTSGSTGVPKQITANREQLKASARLTNTVLDLQKNQTSLVCLDTRYIAGIMMMVRSLEAGMNMIIAEPSSNPLEKLKEDDIIDFTALVPLQLETILKSPQRDKLNRIKKILIGGASIRPKTTQELKSMTCHFFATYGMTETLSHIALQKLNGERAQDFFEALPGITLSQDHRDCLVIEAPHIQKEPIVTNDLIELINSSQFKWLGRVDTVINTGGVKVIPEKIEALLLPIFEEHKITNRFFIGALADGFLGESVNLFIEGTPLLKEVEDNIQHKMKASLHKFEIPKSFQYVSSFVITDTGKINKPKTISLNQSSTNSSPASSFTEEV